MEEVKSIHTLNARGNVMLEVIKDYFNLSSSHMFHEIQGMRREVEALLACKGISYDALKTALVPDRKRREKALVFDSTEVGDHWYGYPIFDRLIPLFDKASNNSILTGDYIGDNEHQRALYEALAETLILQRSVNYKHSTQFHIVYINNLTPTMMKRFDDGLAAWQPYVGYADTTFGSKFKYLLSGMLVNLGIKHGATIIQGHEDDRPDQEDVNMCSYPFEESGYVCRSIQSTLEDLFLSYKIERPVMKGFEVDTEFSLNSIADTPLPLGSFSIEVEETKLAYLKNEKSGSMARTGLSGVTSAELAELIRQKINASYIYNLAHNAEHRISKFNIILELDGGTNGPTRLLASLEYQALRKALRLITLF